MDKCALMDLKEQNEKKKEPWLFFYSINNDNIFNEQNSSSLRKVLTGGGVQALPKKGQQHDQKICELVNRMFAGGGIKAAT